VFPLVRELADDDIDVALACRVLNVSRSGYYEWRTRVKSARAQQNELPLKVIEKIHSEPRGTYGAPRIHAELVLGLGETVNHKRVARLMRDPTPQVSGLRGRAQSARVVITSWPRRSPRSPSERISRSTVQRATGARAGH
jgi:transposase InsO family protein